MSKGRRREPVDLSIDALSHEGRGVGRLSGKTVFVHGALPGERVRARIVRRRGQFDEAETLEVLDQTALRIAPRCEHFGLCGGCALQHLGEAEQLTHKQSVLLELLERQNSVSPETVREPVRGPQWGYRRKARLGVKRVPKKGGVIIGFRERSSPYVTDCRHCDTLDPRIGARLPALRELIDGLSIADRIPQIEVACSDERAVLVLRHLEAFSDTDLEALARFGEAYEFEFWLQSGGPDTALPLSGTAHKLHYRIEECELEFAPLDFTQVNAAINVSMVRLALQALELNENDRVLDLFCGLGNFTLPIAKRAGQVLGCEGESRLIDRARENALSNGLRNCEFRVADLTDPGQLGRLSEFGANKLLLDPPRSGARDLLESVSLENIERLVYVSCNPVTFARDAATLCDKGGFRLVETGILDMFPQTAHVESLSLFVKL